MLSCFLFPAALEVPSPLDAVSFALCAVLYEHLTLPVWQDTGKLLPGCDTPNGFQLASGALGSDALSRVQPQGVRLQHFGFLLNGIIL